MDNEELLKEKRASILNDLVNEIKDSIEKNKVEGEKSSKIFIYNRLADFTYYSEVSIRKFVSGYLPKDLSSFIEGIVQYSKLCEVDEDRIQNLVNEYVQAANAVVIQSENKITTKNNLVPLDLTSIIRPKRLVRFLDSFIAGEANIAYIYGYNTTGKTKSVMAYISDLINRNMFDNIMWQDVRENNQLDQIYDLVFRFNKVDTSSVDDIVKEESCLEYIQNSKCIIVLDFGKSGISEESIDFIKKLAKYAKVVIISSDTYSKYEEYLAYYTEVFSANNMIDEEEFERYVKNNEVGLKLYESNPEVINELYKLSGGSIFCISYILKQIAEENKMGVSLKEAAKMHMNVYSSDYKELATKVIESIWNSLSLLAKKILYFSSKFDFSVSTDLIAYICDVKITEEKWREALKELYQSDSITAIILNNPRLSVNNMIKTLVVALGNNMFDENIFIDRIGKYYVNLSKSIGECYNDLNKLKVLDDMDEWDIVTQTLNYLHEKEKYEEYINIVRELKYYIYVRGMWFLGDDSWHLQRAKMANLIGNKAEELEGLCDYINICAKSKNEHEAIRFLEVAEKIVDEDKEKINTRIICLFYHVKALYLANCLKEYQKAYDIWNDNHKKYYDQMHEYRKLVNVLWEDRCYMKIEKDANKVCERLIASCENAKSKNFTRGIVDYELLIASKELELFDLKGYKDNLEEAKKYLAEAKIILDENTRDIRNEAFYYRLLATINTIENNKEEKELNVNKAIELYSLMNCRKDIEYMKLL